MYIIVGDLHDLPTPLSSPSPSVPPQVPINVFTYIDKFDETRDKCKKTWTSYYHILFHVGSGWDWILCKVSFGESELQYKLLENSTWESGSRTFLIYNRLSRSNIPVLPSFRTILVTRPTEEKQRGLSETGSLPGHRRYTEVKEWPKPVTLQSRP